MGVADKTWCLSRGKCFRGWGSRPGIWWSIKALSPGSWQDYYTWRGLSLDSPMAVLLTYPLTVYYVITHLVPQSFPELNIQNKQSLKIHVVEAGKEFDLVMVFWVSPQPGECALKRWMWT